MVGGTGSVGETAAPRLSDADAGSFPLSMAQAKVFLPRSKEYGSETQYDKYLGSNTIRHFFKQNGNGSVSSIYSNKKKRKLSTHECHVSEALVLSLLALRMSTLYQTIITPRNVLTHFANKTLL